MCLKRVWSWYVPLYQKALRRICLHTVLSLVYKTLSFLKNVCITYCIKYIRCVYGFIFVKEDWRVGVYNGQMWGITPRLHGECNITLSCGAVVGWKKANTGIQWWWAWKQIVDAIFLYLKKCIHMWDLNDYVKKIPIVIMAFCLVVWTDGLAN